MSKRFQKQSTRRPSAGPIGVKVKADLQNAVALHQRGHLAEAERIYRQILKAAADYFDATHLLGVVLLQRHQLVEAQQLLAKALKLNPKDPNAHFNHGLVLHELGRLEGALASYDRAIAIRPDAEVLCDRGNVLQKLKRFEQAVASYDRAIALKPGFVDAFSNRGVALKELKRFDDALTSCDKAIALRPGDAKAFSNRGNVLQKLKRLDEALASHDRAIALRPDYAEAFNNRGSVLQQLGRFDEALASYDRAIALRPNLAEAFSNRGNVLQKLKRLDEALASHDRAIALRPDYAEAFSNRGNVLQELKRLDEALASHDRAIALRPDYAEAFSNRGDALQKLERFKEAVASYDQAIALKPGFADALRNRGGALIELKRFDEALTNFDEAIALKPNYADGYSNRAHCRLLVGRYEEGWSDYEWRWGAEDFQSNQPDFKVPTWQGEDLSGRGLLVFSEQGFGDVIQFVRFLPLLAERKCKITLLTHAKLLPLLRLSIEQMEIVSELSGVESFDFQIPLMSLPLAFNTRLETIPSKTPYLVASPARMKVWEERLPKSRALRVGIGWAGNPNFPADKSRSIGLPRLLPLLSVPGVQFISLQKDLRSDDEELLRRHPQLIHLGDELKDFSDTAAVMSLLDLMISSDTAPVHLAGALGRPVWVLLRHVPDWRWLLDREDSPWYASARLFRQPVAGDWDSIVAKVIAELSLLLRRGLNLPSASTVSL